MSADEHIDLFLNWNKPKKNIKEIVLPKKITNEDAPFVNTKTKKQDTIVEPLVPGLVTPEKPTEESTLDSQKEKPPLEEVETESHIEVDENPRPKICVYHGNCDDGFASAFAMWKKFRFDNIKYCVGIYSQELNIKPEGKDVYLVDFSYKPYGLKKLLKVAHKVTILDHHKTAEEDLKGLDKEYSNLELVFDQKRSGCAITWDYFFPNEDLPDILAYIQDNDINKKEFRETTDVIMGLRSFEYEFDLWNKLSIPNLIKDGRPIRRFMDKNIKQELRSNVIKKKIAGYEVDTLNLPRFASGAACTLLAYGKPFAATYYDSPKGKVYSLRSDRNGLDVSAISKQFGGGGHKRASGFLVTASNKHLIKKVKALKVKSKS